MLKRKAEEYGAKLVCWKKSHLFLQWLSKTNEPYVLFTDWREAKHCVKALDQCPESRPIFTSVFCIDAKQQSRADCWVSTLEERKDPIYITGSLALAEMTVKSLLLQASKVVNSDVQVPSMSPLNQMMNGDEQMSCSVDAVHPIANAQLLPRFEEVQPMKDEVQATERPYHILSSTMGVPLPPSFELTRPKNGMQADTASQRMQLTKQDVPVSHALQQTQLKENQVQALPLCVTKTTNSPVAVELHVNPVVTDFQSKVMAHVAWIWESLASPAEVERVLLEAMPEIYED